jgi:imidazolonepropionase-like amidohydrolase
MEVVINEEEITSIISHRKNTHYHAKTVVDSTEKFLMPGLWDMHTHSWWTREDVLPLLAAHGVTGIREMFGDMETVKKMRREVMNGQS